MSLTLTLRWHAAWNCAEDRDNFLPYPPAAYEPHNCATAVIRYNWKRSLPRTYSKLRNTHKYNTDAPFVRDLIF